MNYHRDRLIAANREIDALKARQQELFRTITELSKHAINEKEAAEMRAQIAALMTEVGTLRAKNAGLERLLKGDRGGRRQVRTTHPREPWNDHEG